MTVRLPDDCEQLLLVRDRAARATALICVHDTRLGPAHGGIRRWAYRSSDEALADVVALARAMTFKCALAEVPAGGGKAVLIDHDGLDRRGAYELVGRTVERLEGRFFTGPDVNTTADDLDVVAEQTRFVATGRDDGGSGGPGDLAAATAQGVFAAMRALCRELATEPAGLHVVVQGLGAVGMDLVRRLHAANARVSVHDVIASRVDQAVRQYGATALPESDVLTTPCDVFAPCALGSVLTRDVVDQLPARGVCGAANNIFAGEAAALRCHERGIVAVPDFIANAGALIAGATFHLRGERVDAARIDRVGETAAAVLQRAAAERRPPSELALELARERVERGPAQV
ncbi:MAG: Glu/Leu/Phe/Val dehydrogenase dimerization domain-containing protein [Planctomycetota bacterium]